MPVEEMIRDDILAMNVMNFPGTYGIVFPAGPE
jgi:hypothetical protein